MKKVIITGKSGSGKNYLLNGLILKGFEYSPKITTRPKRINEIDGMDYTFIDNDLFEKYIDDNKIDIRQKFLIKEKIWWYGFLNEDFISNNLFILTPFELKSLKNRNDYIIVFIDTDEKTLRKRLLSRNDDSDSVDRRMLSDNKDFENFEDYDIHITESFFKIDDVFAKINEKSL